MHNTSHEVGRVIWQTRPAMRTETFFETIWGLARDGKVSEDRSPGLLQIAVLGSAYSDQFRLTSPPYGLQRILFFILHTARWIKKSPNKKSKFLFQSLDQSNLKFKA